MIDTTVEKPIPLDQLPPEAIPGRRGKPVHQVTLSLWYRRGVRGVRLETIMIGGRRATTLEALSRFYTAVSLARSKHPAHSLNPAWVPAEAAPTPRTGRDKSKAVRRAMDELAKRGAGV